jgi:SAM-dependent methyltransferase
MAVRADAHSNERAAHADLLRCPRCRARVDLQDAEAVCLGQRHRYEVIDGVVVLVDQERLDSDAQYAGQRAFFAEEFAAYREYHPANWRVSYLDRLCAHGLVSSRTAATLIDVGVGGSGHTVIEAARRGMGAVGCDLSLDALVRARRFALTEGLEQRTLWVCCSAERLPFADGAFSSALAIAVLEHVPDDRSALNEIARVLQPRGRAWITVPHALRHIAPLWRAVNRRHDQRLGHLRRYEAVELVDETRRAGLDLVGLQYTGHSVKVLQLVAPERANALWWWCERRDLARASVSRGSMQLSAIFERKAQ